MPQGKEWRGCLCYKIAPDLSRTCAEVLTPPLECDMFKRWLCLERECGFRPEKSIDIYPRGKSEAGVCATKLLQIYRESAPKLFLSR